MFARFMSNPPGIPLFSLDGRRQKWLLTIAGSFSLENGGRTVLGLSTRESGSRIAV